MATRCYTWGLDPIAVPNQWITADWTWSECAIVDEIVSTVPFGVGVDATQLIPYWLRDDDTKKSLVDVEKRKRFIKLLCKVKGIEYIESKEVKDNIKVSVDDVAIVVKAVKGVNLIVKES